MLFSKYTKDIPVKIIFYVLLITSTGIIWKKFTYIVNILSTLNIVNEYIKLELIF